MHVLCSKIRTARGSYSSALAAHTARLLQCGNASRRCCSQQVCVIQVCYSPHAESWNLAMFPSHETGCRLAVQLPSGLCNRSVTGTGHCRNCTVAAPRLICLGDVSMLRPHTLSAVANSPQLLWAADTVKHLMSAADHGWPQSSVHVAVVGGSCRAYLTGW
jgi:hypothetical protein